MFIRTLFCLLLLPFITFSRQSVRDDHGKTSAPVSRPLLVIRTGDGIFNLKKGDWFEFQVKFDQGATEQYRYQFRYELLDNKENNFQEYKLTLQRFNIMRLGEYDIWTGFDSNYPPYSDRSGDSVVLEYKFQVTPAGYITWPEGAKRKSEVVMTQVSPRKDLGMTISIIAEPLPAGILHTLTEMIFAPYRSDDNFWISGGGKNNSVHVSRRTVTGDHQRVTISSLGRQADILLEKQTGVPAVIKIHGNSIILTGASFVVPGNTVVKGRILNYKPGSDSARINNKKFPLRKDGSFLARLLLKQPGKGYMSYKGQSFNSFLTPGDTLEVYADGAGFNNSLVIKGGAAENTRVAIEAEKLFQSLEDRFGAMGMGKPNEKVLLAMQREINSGQNRFIAKYRRKASAECIAYFQTEWRYLMAELKLRSLYRANYRYSEATKLPFQGFPPDYFVDIDTLPVLMNEFTGGEHYWNYFRWFISFQRARSGIAGIGSGEFGFFENYPIAIASLKGYPLYTVLQEDMMDEIMDNTWEDNQRLQPYFEEFVKNCRDTSLTGPLERQWAMNLKWAQGKPSPLTELLLADGSVLSLSKFKGRPLCVIVNFNPGQTMDAYYMLLSKPEYKNVQFLVAQPDLPYNKGDPGEKILSLPNITYVKLKGSANYVTNSLGINRFDTKAFLTDAWGRTVDGPILLFSNQPENPVLMAALTAGLNKEHYSPEEKALLTKIGLWIVASVLVASFFTLFFIRRARHKFKEREAVKRQIKELEIKAIRSQMNPHFIFNALNSIQALINSMEVKQANIYLSKFSVLLRNVLNNSEQGMIALSEELEAVQLYCELEKLRFDFQFSLTVDPEVDPLTAIPGMIIQPLAENAIVHGLAAKREDGVLEIRVSTDGFKLQVIVVDNGSGFTAASDQLSGKGFGLKLVEERMNILTANGRQAGLAFRATHPDAGDKGTTAILTFPLEE